MDKAIADLCSTRFEEITAATEAESVDGEAAPPVPYRRTPYGLVMEKPTKDGPVDVPLTNFSARIVGDAIEDDGAEQRRSFEIEAELRGRRSSFSVPAERYIGMGWPPEHLGAAAIVYPGFGTKDHARAAIQMLSGDVPLRHRYAHIGWREIGGRWMYLHAGGGPIGPNGPLSGIEVSLGEGRLGDYSLPTPPSGDDLARAIHASLRFLELAPPTITVPLLAAVYRAPLGEASPVDLSLALVGPTGTQKTELTAMAQAHYGAAFNGRRLPANWTSTENALEKQAFATKDALMVVDDFAPTGTTYDVARLHRTADRLLRAQGNRSGRGRMRADTTLRAEYYPRGLIVSSGEDVPRGQSLRSRMLVLEVSPGAVDLGVLTEVQQAAAQGLLASAMSGYLLWLAPRMDDLKGTSGPPEGVKGGSRRRGRARPDPGRRGEPCSGLETFLQFAAECGAVTDVQQRIAGRGPSGAHRGGERAGGASVRGGADPTVPGPPRGLHRGRDAHFASSRRAGSPRMPGAGGGARGSPGRNEYRALRVAAAGQSAVGWLAEDGSLLLEPGAASRGPEEG
jgi:hypothetical protein